VYLADFFEKSELAQYDSSGKNHGIALFVDIALLI
jgi:hypothetical protein